MEKKNILHLPVTSEWFFMIEFGKKQEEYREINDYWRARLLSDPDVPLYIVTDKPEVNPHVPFRNFDGVRMRRGYTKKFIDFGKPTIRIGRGKPEWGAPENRDVFIITLVKEKQQ